jgi:hypothetical protein
VIRRLGPWRSLEAVERATLARGLLLKAAAPLSDRFAAARHGSTDTTIDASSSPSATSHRPRPKPATTTTCRIPPWRRRNQTTSPPGNPVRLTRMGPGDRQPQRLGKAPRRSPDRRGVAVGSRGLPGGPHAANGVGWLGARWSPSPASSPSGSTVRGATAHPDGTEFRWNAAPAAVRGDADALSTRESAHARGRRASATPLPTAGSKPDLAHHTARLTSVNANPGRSNAPIP